MTFLSGNREWITFSKKSQKLVQTFVHSDLCLNILRTCSAEISSRSLANLNQSLAAVLNCGIEWVYAFYAKAVYPNMTLFSFQYADIPPGQQSLVMTRPWLTEPFDIAAAGRDAAASLFVGDSGDAELRQNIGIPLAWMITSLYSCNRPFFWRLSSMDRMCHVLCDHPPSVVANMKMGDPKDAHGSEVLQLFEVLARFSDQ
jgi:hypothetical protein